MTATRTTHKRRVGMVLCVALGVGTALIGGALLVASQSGQSRPAGHATHFAGLPPVGARYSMPAHGSILLNIDPHSGNWNVFADGRIIFPDPDGTGYVQQRLTPQGARLLWSRVRAIGGSVGLFKHNVSISNEAYEKHGLSDWYQVRSGRRLIGLSVGSPPPDVGTPAQLRALGRINGLLAHSGSRLPASAWADRTIRPYVPANYELVFDRAAPDPAKLPSPARELLAQDRSVLDHAVGCVTTGHARALLTAFADAGVKFARNTPGEIDVELPTAVADPRYTVLEFLPDPSCA